MLAVTGSSLARATAAAPRVPRAHRAAPERPAAVESASAVGPATRRGAQGRRAAPPRRAGKETAWARSARTASTTTATEASTTTIRSASAPSTTTRARSPGAFPTTPTTASTTASSMATPAWAMTGAGGSQMRSRERRTELSLRLALRDRTRGRLFAVRVAGAKVRGHVRQAAPKRLRLFRLLRRSRADHARPHCDDVHGRRLRRPGQVPAVHAGDAMLESLRSLRVLHRQADAPRRVRSARRVRALQLPHRIDRLWRHRRRALGVSRGHQLRDRLLFAAGSGALSGL